MHFEFEIFPTKVPINKLSVFCLSDICKFIQTYLKYLKVSDEIKTLQHLTIFRECESYGSFSIVSEIFDRVFGLGTRNQPLVTSGPLSLQISEVQDPAACRVETGGDD